MVGEELERRYDQCEVWVPSQDTGTDLLLTNKKDRRKNIGLQVKFSKDFLLAMESDLHPNLLACGWWTLGAEKIKNSNATLWVMAPYSFLDRQIYFVILPPSELLGRLEQIHGTRDSYNVYLWVTKDGRCFETRGIGKPLQAEIVSGKYLNVPVERDFSAFLADWSQINNAVL